MKLTRSLSLITGLLCCAGIAVYSVRTVTANEANTETAAVKKQAPGSISYPVNAPQLASIKVAPVKEVNLPIADAMNGKLAFDENITARVSSPVLGRIMSVPVEIGDVVTKNMTLAQLDSPDLATADADWAKAKADEYKKKLAFDRAKGLFEHEVIARKDYESAEADYVQAQAETRRSNLRMRNLNASGNENGQFALKAPIAGILVDKQVNPGMEARPDAPGTLFTISNLSRLWLLIDVPERLIGQIQPGQKIGMELDAYPDQIFPATVDRVGLVLDPNTRRIQVRASVPNEDKKLRPEMFARVSFLSEDNKKALRVPNASLIVEGLHNYVFIEKREGEYQKQRVNLVRKSKDASFVDQGLAAGQKIVTEGALLLNSEVASHAQ